MPRPPIWTIEVRCKDGDQPSLSVEVPAHSALEALTSTVAELGDALRRLDAAWPTCVTVLAHPSPTRGHQFSVKCRCGADWGVQDRCPSLHVLNDIVPNHHGPGRCEDRWPENRTPTQPEPASGVGAEIRQGREAAGMSQAQLAKAVGVSPTTISTSERVLGGVSPQTMGRIRTALDEAGA